MGTITALFWTYLQAGDEIITDLTLDGCTFALFSHGFPHFGIKVTHIDMTDPANLEAAINDKTKFVYFETPANLNMRIVDVAAISKIVHKYGARVIVDNTYATPITIPTSRSPCPPRYFVAECTTKSAPSSIGRVMIMVIDGHPATLSWLGGVDGHKTISVGVVHFGQTGTVQDLYHHYGINADNIVAAASELSDGPTISHIL